MRHWLWPNSPQWDFLLVCPQANKNEASVLYGQSSPPKMWPYLQTGRCHWTHPVSEVPFAGSYPLKAWAFILKKNFSPFITKRCNIQKASRWKWPLLGPSCLHALQRDALFQQENWETLPVSEPCTQAAGAEGSNKRQLGRNDFSDTGRV